MLNKIVDKFLLLLIFTLLVGCSTLAYKINSKPPHWRLDAVLPDAIAVTELENQVRALEPIIKYGNKCTATVVYSNYAVTAAHCVDKGEEYEVTGTKKLVKVVYYDVRLDRAILQGDFSAHKSMDIDLTEDLLHSVPAAAYCGFPAGSDSHGCRRAMLSGFDYFAAVFAGPAMPGMSGGPVIDMQSGKLIGVIYGVNQIGQMIANTTTGMFSSAHIKTPN